MLSMIKMLDFVSLFLCYCLEGYLHLLVSHHSLVYLYIHGNQPDSYFPLYCVKKTACNRLPLEVSFQHNTLLCVILEQQLQISLWLRAGFESLKRGENKYKRCMMMKFYFNN